MPTATWRINCKAPRMPYGNLNRNRSQRKTNPAKTASKIRTRMVSPAARADRTLIRVSRMASSLASRTWAGKVLRGPQNRRAASRANVILVSRLNRRKQVIVGNRMEFRGADSARTPVDLAQMPPRGGIPSPRRVRPPARAVASPRRMGARAKVVAEGHNLVRGPVMGIKAQRTPSATWPTVCKAAMVLVRVTSTTC